ncbi:MAG: hypothetical protein K0R55_4648 [Sporomusa sp.]|jgi:hypothetical protein|nr:hypothetical protein [Sporomusa sp.]
MQARVADIRHRLEMCKKQQGTLLPVLLDVEFLLAELQEAQTENKHARTVNKNIRENNKKLRCRERVLREALEFYADHVNDDEGKTAREVLGQEGKYD